MKGFRFLLRKKKIYVCPFHAEEKSGRPGQCPHCNMYLVEEAPRPASLRERLRIPWGRR